MISAPDPTEVGEATPTLAKIVQRLVNRPYYMVGEPFPVDGETYQKAQDEMTAVLEARGWRGPGLRANIDRMNFLLLGTPIVLEQ